MAIRVLLVVAAFAVLYGCGPASSPVKEVKEPTTPETAPPTPQPAPEPTTPAASALGGGASATASAGMSGEEQAVQSEADCRLVTYVSNENMSQQEANDFAYQVAHQMFEQMQDDPSLTAGPAQNKVLDDLGVPRYSECKVGGE